MARPAHGRLLLDIDEIVEHHLGHAGGIDEYKSASVTVRPIVWNRSPTS